ncbi:MAG: DEAD/DEAH box helicase, partial [Actinobacteria bacterium]|nr:DEAD/DEAH box helicase [Actinomycetota bacterium]
MQTSDAAAGDDRTADQTQAEAQPLTLEDLEISDDTVAQTEIPEPAESAAQASDAEAPAATEQPAEPEKSRNGFDVLGLDERVLRAIKSVGYETPSAIQEATIPVLLSGRDVVGLAQTGTGKTAAFALPILSRIEPGQGVPQALVLAPTRELALQVCEAFESYAKNLNVHLLPVYGGQAYGQQLSALRRGVDIVVGTPGRIMDHLKRGSLDLTEIKYLVLDEADEMLKMGFAEDVETILADTP